MTLDTVLYPAHLLVGQFFALVKIAAGFIAFFTTWTEGDSALLPVGDSGIKVLQIANALSFIFTGAYSFVYTLMGATNAYLLEDEDQIGFLSDGVTGTILDVVATILGLIITITSKILDPKIVLSDNYEITSLYTMDIAFTYIPVALRAIKKVGEEAAN